MCSNPDGKLIKSVSQFLNLPLQSHTVDTSKSSYVLLHILILKPPTTFEQYILSTCFSSVKISVGAKDRYDYFVSTSFCFIFLLRSLQFWSWGFLKEQLRQKMCSWDFLPSKPSRRTHAAQLLQFCYYPIFSAHYSCYLPPGFLSYLMVVCYFNVLDNLTMPKLSKTANPPPPPARPSASSTSSPSSESPSQIMEQPARALANANSVT